MAYKRILLKLSGEALMGSRQYGIDPVRLAEYAEDIKSITSKGVEVAIVIGGGNIFRGVAGAKWYGSCTRRPYGNVSNSNKWSCAAEYIEDAEVPTRLQSAIHIDEVAEPFIRRKAMRHLEKGRVVIFGGGTGTLFHNRLCCSFKSYRN